MLFNNLVMTFVVIWMSSMVDYKDGPLSGMGMSGDSIVKALQTDHLIYLLCQWYCWLVCHLCEELKCLN